MARLPLPYLKKRPRLEIIPFIDIMFFLLVTFLMVSMRLIQNHGISVHLPPAATSTSQSRQNEIYLTVTGNNMLFWNQEEIFFEALTDRLKSAHQTSSHLQIFINGDGKANFKKIVQVLDMVRSVGITTVTIVTGDQQSAADRKL